MEKVVGPRMRRKSSSLELVVQHSVSSNRARPATHGNTNRVGNPETHTYYGVAPIPEDGTSGEHKPEYS